MFLEATLARREIARRFAMLNYAVDETGWRSLMMGIKRDLQAKRLRPNVPLPARRQLLFYLAAMYRETGSLGQALASLLHDGAWTSSGGSFRLAQALGIDLHRQAQQCLQRRQRLTYLEIGAAWAGYRHSDGPARENSLAGLAQAFAGELGRSVFLHFTNLTPWHRNIEAGVVEHPYVTAAGLGILERQGVRPGSVDILYSQAAVYFEPDLPVFLRSAARLMRPDGLLIFNHEPDLSAVLDSEAQRQGLTLRQRALLGGMNGAVVCFERMAVVAEKPEPLTPVARPLLAFPQRECA